MRTILVPENVQRLPLRERFFAFPVSFSGGDDSVEFLIIFISYLASGVIENNMIIRFFLTIIFSIAGIIGMQATKSFVKEMRKNK